MAGYPSTVVIEGSGLAALVSAIALKRAYPAAQIAIHEGGEAFRSEFAGAATPFIHHFHRQIGLDANVFIRRTGAQTIGTTLWQQGSSASQKVSALSAIPYPEGVALHQIWLSAPVEGRPDWSSIALRYQTRSDQADGHGLRFDASAYVDLLVEMVAHLGIQVSEDVIPANAQFDLRVLAQKPHASDVWSFDSPQSGNGLGAELIRRDGGQTVWINPAWSASRRTMPDSWRTAAPWTEQGLCIGTAALAIESFDGRNLCAVMADILRAIELMPARADSLAEIAEYNRRTSAIHDMLLDWHALKWGASAPAGLTQLKQQFLSRGRVPFRDEDPVAPAEWINWFMSLGILPDRTDPTTSSLAAEAISKIIGNV